MQILHLCTRARVCVVGGIRFTYIIMLSLFLLYLYGRASIGIIRIDIIRVYRARGYYIGMVGVRSSFYIIIQSRTEYFTIYYL